MKMLKPLQIILVEFDESEVPENKRFLAQSNDYPVINGHGRKIDEAVEDLMMHILLHLHNRRKGRV